ncbi:gamma-glutamylcyclotransferase [Dokdonella sp. MW10]|uniref:gamma-glutamylcyclotransferase n=1 Tax=Dokdonella sp. MW10 TaxID=2992926 RepID=UPI003F7E56BE
MSIDTTAINREANLFAGHDEVWLFGYGSLIYKADFAFLERRPARLHGWSRRFWQGSHDHRGTPARPGRVATLVTDATASCLGMAYRITPDVFAHLDHREKNGYLRHALTLDLLDGREVEGLVYVAREDNAAWLGPGDDDAIARQIATARGPSGSNRDYVLALADALHALGEQDAHVSSLERRLRGVDA